jgi:prostaglandin-endoperoxide synthase 2
MIEDIPSFLLKPIVEVVNRWPWLGKKVNAVVINNLINVCRHRPHPWSTVHDYVSWTSLTDQHWSARHLPAAPTLDLPPEDQLVKFFERPNGQQRFCSKSTCLFPSFAQYLTDGFTRTRMPDTSAGESFELRRQNTSNHQIDMCPLYGRTQEQTHALRLKSEAAGKRGRLKSQIFADEEYGPFLFQDDGTTVKEEFLALDKSLGIDNFTDPELRARIFAFGGDRTNSNPQVAMINTLFLREHNRLAGEIEKRHTSWDDERVFETARNTVIVLFLKVVVEEYINHISSSPFRFRVDPSVAWDAPWNKPNWITAEFSLLYRWHSLIPDTITWNKINYPVGDTFMDNRPLLAAGLVGAFSDMSSQRAGQLGAFNTAKALHWVEKIAIMQGRLCRLAPYADYRAYVSLPRPKDFSDISQDQRVVDFLRSSYKSPAEIDFYIGLFAEDTEKNSPLPLLIRRMVAVDAFSQALTNPLLSKHVFNPETFSKPGWEAIQTTSSLRDILERNSPGGVGSARISMTLSNWKYSW